jgi:hypothetical protein
MVTACVTSSHVGRGFTRTPPSPAR